MAFVTAGIMVVCAVRMGPLVWGSPHDGFGRPRGPCYMIWLLFEEPQVYEQDRPEPVVPAGPELVGLSALWVAQAEEKKQ